ncbi:hypothetical protein ACIBG8_25285 [Nonomuraea sp. NPDC050556]|uniref:hypothetical protein n=1 Tax=Nonomuraea sp. NPDC050556 TaxID=3364369 RepID=UPI0037BCA3A7
MLTSKVWRQRLAKKSSALGIASTLVLFVGATLTTSPAHAATKQFAYTCSGGPFTNTSISVGITAPDTTPSTSGSTFDATFNIPTLTIAQTSIPTAATSVQVTGTLTVTGGTVSDTGVKTGAAVAAQATSAPAGDAKYKVAVTTGQTGKVTLKPGELKLGLLSNPSLVTTCTTTSTETVDVTIGTGGGTGTVTAVEYVCVTGSDTATQQYVTINTTLTMPTSAKVGEAFSIGWTGTYVAGEELKAPSTGTLAAKIFPYATLTGITGLTSATGEGATGTITAGQIIPLPTTSVSMKATASAAGTVTVKPGTINFGSTASTGTTPAIKCEVDNASELKTYTFTVSAANSTSTPTVTPTTPKPTTTRTVVVTKTPVQPKPSGKVTKTPKAGAETGGGGDMGPDGRTFILVGSLLIMAAGAGGLFLRRRTAQR